MNGIAAPIVAHAPSPTQDFLKPRRKVSVVMVVYMTGEALEQSLQCVLADPLVDELVVVDNGSTRTEAQRLKGLAERDGRVCLVSGHGNVGFARGANLGAKKAHGDVLVFLNPDAFLQAGCIDALARAIEDHVRAGRRVLLVSTANVAVDNAVKEIVDFLKPQPGEVLRVGPPHLPELAANDDIQLHRLAARTTALGNTALPSCVRPPRWSGCMWVR